MTEWRNVAVIAPRSDLEFVEDEVRAVVAALRPLVLRDSVTVRDVAELLTGNALDCVWFAGHGNREGVQLTDGMLTISTLIQLVKASGARLVVLNSCDSEQVAAWLHMQTGAAVICTITNVNDRAAWLTGTLLAKNLAAGMGIEESFNRSKPGDIGQAQVYRLFNHTYTPGQETARLVEIWQLLLQPITDQLDELGKRIGGVENKLQHLSEISMTVHPARRIAWVIGAILFAVPFVASGVVNLWLHGLPLLYYAPATVAVLTLSVVLLAWGLSFWRW